MGPMLCHMAKTGKLTDAHLQNRKSLTQHLRKELNRSLKTFKLYVEIHQSFLKQAEQSWKKGDKQIAIVLLAVAIEHRLNHYARDAFSEKGLKDLEITNIIRSVNTDNKLTWLMSLSGGKAMPDKIRCRIKRIFDIRNAIVHYKGAPSDIDKNNGSHSAIDKELKLLGRFSIHRTFRSIDSFLEKQLSVLQPWRWTATRAYYIIIDDFDPETERDHSK